MMERKTRGFTLVDTGMVPEHMVNYGSRYLPAWEFEKQLRPLLAQPRTISDGLRPPMLPFKLRVALPIARTVRALARRLRRA